MASLSPARKAAFDILLAVALTSDHSDTLLRSHNVDKLSDADRNLTTTLVLGTLRWQHHLDAQIKSFLAKPNAKLDEAIRITLRLGAFQLLHLDRIPAHAAIDEGVELAKRSGHVHASRMVNAVLRKLAASAESLRPKSDADFAEAAIAAHPAWLVERWTARYGAETTRMLCVHGQSQPALIARLVDPSTEAALNGSGLHLEPAPLLTAARRIPSSPPAFDFSDEMIRIQDEGSQLIGEIAASLPATSAKGAKSIGDTCAAPGGKTLILAERNPSAHITACEQSPQRLAALKKRLAHLGTRVECIHADATDLKFENEFDVVLADVPCSGTGTLGRNPEIRHRLALADLTRHATRQKAILTAAIRAAKSGGHIVYSTCSLEPEENEQVVEAVLVQTPNASIAHISPHLDAMRASDTLTQSGADQLRQAITPEGYLRLLPGALPTDGFFVALLIKLS
ncbi:MAG: methyltransferase domain-containing protein [Acidobacteriota bacterium]|nr:methyltransferase domain-containing protein [Acidobacteriota bacterium]